MAYRDSTSNSGSSDTPNVAVPTGVAADDIVILAATMDNSTVTIDAADWPTGFTELAETALTLDGQRCTAGWKRLTGADSGSYTFGSWGGAHSWICQAYAYSGRDTTAPPVASTIAVNNTGNSSPVTITANGLTAVAGDDLLMLAWPDVNTNNAGTGMSAPTSYTEREDAESGFNNAAGFDRENVSAGATGDISCTLTLASGTSGWAALLVRIPAASAPPPTSFPPTRRQLPGVIGR